MDFLHAIILGIVEGITEFLPVSSTGHLILASNLLKIQQSEFVKTFEITIQSGAILSVVFLYARTILKDIEVIKRVLVAFIPTVIIGFTLYKFIKQYLIGNSGVVLISLFIGGVVLILVELLLRSKGGDLDLRIAHMFDRSKSNLRREFGSVSKDKAPTNHLSYEKAFVIGLFQSISMIPGVSRAAATIIGGLLVGLPRKTAVEFSFLLAVPTMIAATALDIRETSFIFDSNQWAALTIGFITSFIVALISIKWLLKYIQTNTFIPFGIYRILLATIYFLLILLH